MSGLFEPERRSCDVTGELVDEGGLVRFYGCRRERNHGGAWHVGYEFGPNRAPTSVDEPPPKQQLWPVAPQQRTEAP